MQKEEILLVMETTALYTFPSYRKDKEWHPKDVAFQDSKRCILVGMNRHLLPNLFPILKTSHTEYKQV